MAPSSKIAKACKAMKVIGISEETVKPVLKNLLDLYNKKWKFIEDENYRVLINAIFDHEIPKKGETRKHESWSEVEPEESEPPLKRTRLRGQTDQSSSSAGNRSPGLGKTFGRTPKEAYVSQTHCKEKIDVSPHLCLVDKKFESSPSEQFSSDRRTKPEHLSSPTHVQDDEEVTQFQFVQKGKKLKCERDTQCFSYEKPKGIPVVDLSDEESVLDKHHNNAVIIKRERDADELPQFDVPLAIVRPAAPLSLAHEDGFTNESSSNVIENDGEFLGTKQLNSEVVVPPTLLLLCEDGSSNENSSDVERNGLELLEYKQLDTEDKGDDCASDSSQFDIASSPQGNVKISLICNSSQQSGFCIPSLDAVLKLVEEKYIKTYRITEPGFSVVKLMKDVCECFLAEGTNCTDDGQVRSTNLTSSLAISKKLSAQDVLCGRGYEGNFCIPPSFPNEPFRFRNFIEVLPQIPRVLTSTSSNVLNYITELNVNGNSYCGRDIKIKALEGLGPSNPSSLVVVQKHNSCLDPLKASHHIDDITRGAENAKISLVNEITDECLPEFHYIPRNIAYEHACVKFLLARISDENCCSNCVGDCMSLIVPCACAGETGGEFAYTHGRLVEEKFLEKCISLNCDPEQHRLFYCKDCPLERSKHKRVSGPCKGHLVRQFIKECWYKCGCSMKCGNRLVQQGITVNLQVFMTPEKGWGVRTLEDLPKGTFVCEYVGEIVTNTELFERNTQMSGREKHTYSVLLDADWGSKGVPRDEEALCLDATVYGNVARFINHRCFDANLVEIPVEVETPDHHYYHLAFFTTRKVDALEELTWDYGIDFKDHSHPVKAFPCCCESMFCRNVKHPKISKEDLVHIDPFFSEVPSDEYISTAPPELVPSSPPVSPLTAFAPSPSPPPPLLVYSRRKTPPPVVSAPAADAPASDDSNPAAQQYPPRARRPPNKK